MCVYTVAELVSNFGRQRWSVHGSGRVCPASGGCQLRPSDMDSGEPAFMLFATRPASSSPWGPSPRL